MVTKKQDGEVQAERRRVTRNGPTKGGVRVCLPPLAVKSIGVVAGDFVTFDVRQGQNGSKELIVKKYRPEMDEKPDPYYFRDF
jgi:hypothetical protein